MRRLSRLFSLEACLRHLVFINHMVPAAKLSKLVPSELELETFNVGGEKMAFVSTGCFFNENFKWAVMEKPALNFEETTYRTYVRRGDHNGVLFLGMNISTRISHTLQHIVARDAQLAMFSVLREHDVNGYSDYDVNVISPTGLLHFRLAAKDEPSAREPFATARDHVDFFTHRPCGYFRSNAAVLMCQEAYHRLFQPWEGHLTEARFEFWERLGVFSKAEAAKPFSVLVEPHIQFRFLFPYPVIGKTFAPVKEPTVAISQ